MSPRTSPRGGRDRRHARQMTPDHPRANGGCPAPGPPYWAGGAGMAVIPGTAPGPASGARRWRRFLTPWRSPADQPAWARPALLAIAAAAAIAYGWGMAGASVESFYGAAARSMSESWHDFIFGAFDPAGTVTIDKLPGALWVQALSLRIFGFHIWALVLPQVVEGVLTVLVLYRAVRRWWPAQRPDRRGRARRHAHHRAAEPRQRVGLAADPAARARRRRHVRRAAHRVAAAAAAGRRLGRPGVPGEDDPGLAGPARAGRRLPARRARRAAAHPVRARRAGRAGHRRGVPVLDDRGLDGAVPGPALRGRQCGRLGVHAGLRLQRRGPADPGNWTRIAGPPSRSWPRPNRAGSC